MLTAFSQFKLRIAPYKYLFWAGVLVKLILGTTLVGDYMYQLFVPFIKYASTSYVTPAYNYYALQGQGNAFPYPTAMATLLCVPRWLAGLVGMPYTQYTTMLDLVLIRAVLFVADVAILAVLLQWLQKHAKQVLIYFWLSPILLYITYIHGQLDVLPIALLIVSIYYMARHKCITASILLAVAMGCKSSILLAVPFIYIYAYKNNNISKRYFGLGIVALVVVFAIINYPIWYSVGYISMVYYNAEQVKLFASALPIKDNYALLIIPALYLLLLIRFSHYWQLNRDLLLMYLGFSFGLITIFIAANQGWYYWCLPFFIYFLIKENKYTKLPFVAIHLFYFIFFALIPASDYASVWQLWGSIGNYTYYNYLTSQGFNITLIINLASTLLQASVIAFCYYLYKYGIAQVQYRKMLHQPYLIGIAGDSATGKSTLAAGLQALFNPNNSTIVSGDDMHKWERGNDKWNTYTHLNPSANNLHLNLQHTIQFIKGNTIQRDEYSHVTGKFNKAKLVKTNKIMILEGLHSYYLHHQQSLIDLKIYLTASDATRVLRKVERDSKERAATTDQVLKSVAARKPDASKYIDQQSAVADIEIQYNDDESVTIHILNHYDMDYLLHQFSSYNIPIIHEYLHNVQVVQCQAVAIPISTIAIIGATYAHDLEELDFGTTQWQANTSGVVQLIIMQALFFKLLLNNTLPNSYT